MTRVSTWSRSLFSHLRDNVYEWSIFVAVTALVGTFSAYVYSLGLIKVFVDQNAHLVIARQVTDSLTPGTSQLGFWPPLLHIVMTPTTMIDSLFTSGFAAAVALAPIVALGAVFLYRLSLLLIPNTAIALGATAFFVLNPYLLYYASTPMTESLFLSLVVITAYWTLRWMDSDRLPHLMGAGITAGLASLARFEGFLLVAIVALIAGVYTYLKGAAREKIEAVLIMFLSLSLLGLAFVFVYGWIYANNPLEFAQGHWSASAQQEDYLLPTAGSFGKSTAYVIGAALFMLSPLSAIFALTALIVAFVVTPLHTRMRITALAWIFASPLLFLLLSLYRGDALIYITALPPFESFYNERYGLEGLGLLVLGVIAAGVALQSSPALSLINRRFAIGAGTMVVVGAVVIQGMFFSQVVFAEKFAIVRESSQGFLVPSEEQAGRALKEHYDGGRILITRALNNAVPITAGIPLSSYIQEANVPFYEDALKAPWEHVRFVVMQNPNADLTAWRKNNELVAVRWGNSQEFDMHFELLFENQAVRLYKLRDELGSETAIAPPFALTL